MSQTCPERIGPYEVRRQIAAGGMGIVYEARDPRDGRRLAVKTVRVVDSALLQGIRREIRALFRLNHPGVVRVVDEGTEAGLPWYAMEWLDGVTLREHARALWSPWTVARPAHARPSLQPGSLRRLLTAAVQVCQALAYVHGEGIVHRDLKPDNVIVDAGGAPVILDFGLASRFAAQHGRESFELASAGRGTLQYMSPEQIRGDLVDPRADLYALGCLLFELLVGKPAHEGSSVTDLVRAHLAGRVEPPSFYVGGISSELDDIILRLMARERADRFAYAQDVGAALLRLGAGDVPGRAAPPARPYVLRAGLAGRSQEMAVLRQAVEQLLHKRGGVVLIAGESGVGKTRLCMELATYATARGCRVLAGAGAEFRPWSLGIFAAPLEALADRCREDGGAELVQRLFGEDGRVLSRHIATLASLPGLDDYAEPAPLPPREDRLRLFGALIGVLERACESGPVALFADDLQWADELSLAFLLYALDSGELGRLSLLFAATYRDEEAPAEVRALAARSDVRHLMLGRLDGGAVAALVGGMLGLTSPPLELSRFLLQRTDGNPFFVAEYILLAVSEGLIRRDDFGRWQVSAGDDESAASAYHRLMMPDTLREVLSRRLAALSPLGRTLCEIAAVLGRSFRGETLAALSQVGDEAFADGASDLLGRSILEEVAGRRGSLRFAHDSIREVVYAAIPRATLVALHARAARLLSAPGQEMGWAEHATAGLHWERAGELELARGCYLTAARSAFAISALVESERLYRRSLALVTRLDEDAVDAKLELGYRVCYLSGRPAEARKLLTEALVEALSTDHGRAIWSTLRHLAQVSVTFGRLDAAIALYRRALAVAQAAGDAAAVGTTTSALAAVYLRMGHLEVARPLFAAALAMQQACGDLSGAAYSTSNLGIVHYNSGDTATARRHFEAALARFRDSGELRNEGHVLGNLASLLLEDGHALAALPLYERSLAIARRVGDRPSVALTLCNIGMLQLELERCEVAARYISEALDLRRTIGDQPGLAWAYGALAAVELAQGKLEAADDHFVAALRLARQVQDLATAGWTLGERARLHLLWGRDQTLARDMAEQAIETLEIVGDPEQLALVLCTRAHVALATGEDCSVYAARVRDLAAAHGLAARRQMRISLRQLERATEHRNNCKLEGGLVGGFLAADLPPGLRARLTGEAAGKAAAKALPEGSDLWHDEPVGEPRRGQPERRD
ncbi:MAG: tetratricopeptide repeat protein [Candidatus Schekmanbacteria bacterium]|nr:tetratricopeptide repeat protein [Candidatus Schekmanbacteria bacterium]